MALKLNDKQAIVAEVKLLADASVAAVLVDYRGVEVGALTDFRSQARSQGVTARVVRNTLARRALAGTSYDCLQSALVGPMMLLFSQEEPCAAARLVRDFMKDCDKMEVKALCVDGQLLGADQLKAVASLPSRDEALAMLMATMLAPVTQLARTLKEPVAQVVRATAAIGEKG